MECERTGHSPSFPRTPAWGKLRQFRSGEARRFHEDLLVTAGGKKRARPFHHFSGNREPPGRPICALLVEQYSIWLRGKKRSAKQDCLRDIFAAPVARQSRADQQCSVRRYVFSVSPSYSLQYCGSRRQVRIMTIALQGATDSWPSTRRHPWKPYSRKASRKWYLPCSASVFKTERCYSKP